MTGLHSFIPLRSGLPAQCENCGFAEILGAFTRKREPVTVEAVSGHVTGGAHCSSAQPAGLRQTLK